MLWKAIRVFSFLNKGENRTRIVLISKALSGIVVITQGLLAIMTLASGLPGQTMLGLGATFMHFISCTSAVYLLSKISMVKAALCLVVAASTAGFAVFTLVLLAKWTPASEQMCTLIYEFGKSAECDQLLAARGGVRVGALINIIYGVAWGIDLVLLIRKLRELRLAALVQKRQRAIARAEAKRAKEERERQKKEYERKKRKEQLQEHRSQIIT